MDIKELSRQNACCRWAVMLAKGSSFRLQLKLKISSACWEKIFPCSPILSDLISTFFASGKKTCFQTYSPACGSKVDFYLGLTSSTLLTDQLFFLHSKTRIAHDLVTEGDSYALSGDLQDINIICPQNAWSNLDELLIGRLLFAEKTRHFRKEDSGEHQGTTEETTQCEHFSQQ